MTGASLGVALVGVDDCWVDVLVLLPSAPALLLSALLLSALLPNLALPPSPDDLVGVALGAGAVIEDCCVDVL